MYTCLSTRTHVYTCDVYSLCVVQVLPYWGSPHERKIIRKYWSSVSGTNGSMPSTECVALALYCVVFVIRLCTALVG